MEDLPADPSAVLGQAYTCTLIMCSHEVVPQHTPDMIKEENEAQEYFEETKDILQMFCLSRWMDQFQNHIETFIQECLSEAAAIMTLPGKAEEDILAPFKRRSWYSSLNMRLLAQSWTKQTYGMVKVVEKCLLDWKDLTGKIQNEEHRQWRVD
ncbi:hypothetical protein EI94DRAFT_1708845 [Lactarius quietus]|nr:hypothetical protein EI94DRAFT_1708845 [Lactarius quietus]